jgi:hypothetical protein
MLRCPLQLALGQQGAVLTKVEKISSFHFATEEREIVLAEYPKTFCENFFSHYSLEVRS